MEKVSIIIVNFYIVIVFVSLRVVDILENGGCVYYSERKQHGDMIDMMAVQIFFVLTVYNWKLQFRSSDQISLTSGFLNHIAWT